MSKKAIYLFLALLLPVLIFLFLKYFGKNNFDIPIYFQEGVSDSVSRCVSKSKGQYFLPDSSLEIFKWKQGSALLIVDDEESGLKSVKEIIEDLGVDKIQLFPLYKLRYDQANVLKKCVLLINSPWNAVLIDNKKRIRGYYKLGNRDETDRLEVELKILLNKY